MSDVASRFRRLVPAGIEHATLRLVREQSELLQVRRGVVQPPTLGDQHGAMVTVIADGGSGYAATSDLSDAGIQAALQRARMWAQQTAAISAVDWNVAPRLGSSGQWRGPAQRPWSDVSTEALLALLLQADAAMVAGAQTVDRSASLWTTRLETLLVDAEGHQIAQSSELWVPNLEAVANRGVDTVRRTLSGRGLCRQGGAELLQALDLAAEAERVGREAAQLLDAAPCPSETMDLLLDPDQMTLQIHESIGHPLELDRILGDERNYAGTSFVTPDMFGSYQYGSPLLNVTFAPDIDGEFASYGYDDMGAPAERAWLIRNGVLERPLGSLLSGVRAGLPGLANARAASWNRPPIDRMANLNVEPGESSFDALVAGIERGVLMRSNCSWSIDDSRNKFQFGCEIGWQIENGQVGQIVRNPNYRGVSATFWRSLDGVGDPGTMGVYGSPFCGKGEPNQVIRVGHASPMCRFRGVEVFGAA